MSYWDKFYSDLDFYVEAIIREAKKATGTYIVFSLFSTNARLKTYNKDPFVTMHFISLLFVTKLVLKNE